MEVEILDSTLREGEQTPYVNFSVEEKLQIAHQLDAIGVDMIEAGDPSVSANTFEAIRQISALNLNAQIVAHSLATKKGISKAKLARADRVVVLYPTSDIHLNDKVNKTREEALAIIKDHVAYAVALGLSVRFTPEDATRTGFDFLVKACNTAIEAGADRISIADTIGMMDPDTFGQKVKRLKQQLLPCKIDVHCHNDLGLALANGLAAINAGADCIHTCINGMGERSGIPDLAETIMALHQLTNMKKYDLTKLYELSNYVQKVTGFFIAPNKPLTGANAFSHKCGVHTDGVLKNPKTYEGFDPSILGRERKIIIDKYTGKRAVLGMLADYGIQPTDQELKNIVLEIKKAGDKRKILHDTDIIEIAEKITDQKNEIIPQNLNALVLISVESHIYTTAVVRRLKNFKNIDNIFEVTGEHDIAAYAAVENTAQLNTLLEELRTVPGIKTTNAKIVLKKHVM